MEIDGFDLGSHRRPISTTSPEAQRYFDLGLNWCYGFNQEEGVRCFRKALELDPGCVMAHWGVAFGSGPFYNLTWRELGDKEATTSAVIACQHIEKARALAHTATDVENELVEAQARRFQKPHAVSPAEYDRWDDDYAAAMRRVHDRHPGDDDVAALFVEALFQGRLGDALAGTDRIRRLLTRDILDVEDRPKLAASTEGYLSMRMHVLVRFGRWHDILAEPPPGDPELFVVSTPMHHYGRAIAHATLKDIAAAEEERRLFHEGLRRVPASRRFFNNPALDILAVGEKMLDGELAYHRGDHETAFAHLREAVHRDDDLAYVEPWAWTHPPRHALAALLLEQGHAEEAEQVYRDDLGLSRAIQRCAQHPGNVWSLHGLVECLERRGDTEELPGLQEQLARALSQADVPITSSCACRLDVFTPTCCDNGVRAEQPVALRQARTG